MSDRDHYRELANEYLSAGCGHPYPGRQIQTRGYGQTAWNVAYGEPPSDVSHTERDRQMDELMRELDRTQQRIARVERQTDPAQIGSLVGLAIQKHQPRPVVVTALTVPPWLTAMFIVGGLAELAMRLTILLVLFVPATFLKIEFDLDDAMTPILWEPLRGRDA